MSVHTVEKERGISNKYLQKPFNRSFDLIGYSFKEVVKVTNTEDL